MKYIDKKGDKVSQSNSHPGMFIIDFAAGGFINVHSSIEVMKQMHPVKKMIDARPVVYKKSQFDNVATFGTLHFK